MIDDLKNIPPTTTVSQLTDKTRDAADGEWNNLNITSAENIFYHVDLDDSWPHGNKDSSGRWAGYTKPKDKNHADDLYSLGHLDKTKKWYLYTFKFANDIIKRKDAVFFHSKVKNGTGNQIKINNIAIDKIEIINIEELK